MQRVFAPSTDGRLLPENYSFCQLGSCGIRLFVLITLLVYSFHLESNRPQSIRTTRNGWYRMTRMYTVNRWQQIPPCPITESFGRVPAVRSHELLPLFQSATCIGGTIGILLVQLFIERFLEYRYSAPVTFGDICNTSLLNFLIHDRSVSFCFPGIFPLYFGGIQNNDSPQETFQSGQ
jgi:hypothetical protein